MVQRRAMSASESAGQGALAIGVDIGGTKVAAGLVNDRGELLYKTRNPMNSSGSPDEAVTAVREAIDRTIKDNPSADVRAIGFSHNTCLPAASAASTISRWNGVGTQMSTTSTSLIAMSSRQLVVPMTAEKSTC